MRRKIVTIRDKIEAERSEGSGLPNPEDIEVITND